MSYKLFLDDKRDPIDNDYVIVRSSDEAIAYIKNNGLPDFMSLDHDLSGEDTTMFFLKEMVNLFPNGPCPNYVIHSANVIGSRNILAFLESWKKTL